MPAVLAPQQLGVLTRPPVEPRLAEWHDLLSVYIFRLHPVPHCSQLVGYAILGLVVKRSAGGDVPECSAEATAVEQGRYALGLLVATSLLQAAAKQTRLAERFPHVTEQCTAIAGMCVGWAVGDAVVKAVGDHLSEAAALPSPPPPPSSAASAASALASAASAAGAIATPKHAAARRLAELVASAHLSRSVTSLLIACAYSTISACAIILLQLTTGCPECGASPMVDAAEEALYSFWGLVSAPSEHALTSVPDDVSDGVPDDSPTLNPSAPTHSAR